MRTVVIGGTGHVGTYLIPRLVQAGHDVVCISRGQRQPYRPHAAWRLVQQATIDRTTEEEAGTFGQRLRDLQPDVVIDMLCFKHNFGEADRHPLSGKSTPTRHPPKTALRRRWPA